MLGSILLLGTCMFMLTRAGICPKQKQTDVPKFTQELGVEDMVRFGSSIAVLCCSQGYDNITWYRKEPSDWMPYPPQSDGRYDVPTLEEKRQILRINKATMGDSTEFRCDLIKNGIIVKQHITKIIVQRCNDLARGPMAVYPYPQNITIDKYGGNITLHCTGYFGCGDTLFHFVRWKVDGKWISNDRRFEDRRFVTHMYYRNDNTSVGQVLTIYNIQPEDIKRSYSCNLRSPQMSFGSTTIPVKISINHATPIKVIIGITVGGVAFVLITVGIGLVVRHLYGPRVKLFYRRIRSRLPRFTPAPERGDTLRYNALLYHAVEDTEKAHNIKDQLVEKGYDIYISDNMKGNQSLGLYEEKVYESMMVLFLYTENLRDDNFAHFLLQSVINIKNFHDIIFLVMDEFVAENVMESTATAVDPEIRQAEGNQEAAENDIIDIDAGNDNIEENTANRDLSFWRSLPKCNIPPENASERVKVNFLCWLQNNIPKFQDQLVNTNRNRRRTSSGRPLLASQIEDGLDPPNSGRLSGNDEVFVLPDENGTVEDKLVINTIAAESIHGRDNDRAKCDNRMNMQHDIPLSNDKAQDIIPNEVERNRNGMDLPANVVEPSGSQNENFTLLDNYVAVSTPYHGDEQCTSEDLASGSSGIESPMSGNFNYDSNEGNKVSKGNTSDSINIQGTPIKDHSSDTVRNDEGRDSEMNSSSNSGIRHTSHKLSTSNRQSSSESGYDTSLALSFSPEARDLSHVSVNIDSPEPKRKLEEQLSKKSKRLLHEKWRRLILNMEEST